MSRYDRDRDRGRSRQSQPQQQFHQDWSSGESMFVGRRGGFPTPVRQDIVRSPSPPPPMFGTRVHAPIVQQQPVEPDEWTCTKCQITNYNGRSSCFKCSITRYDSKMLDARGYSLAGVLPCDTLLIRELPPTATEESIQRTLMKYSGIPVRRVCISNTRHYAFAQVKSAKDAEYMLKCFLKFIPQIDNCPVITTYSKRSMNDIFPALPAAEPSHPHVAIPPPPQGGQGQAGGRDMMRTGPPMDTGQPQQQFVKTPFGQLQKYAPPDTRSFQDVLATSFRPASLVAATLGPLREGGPFFPPDPTFSQVRDALTAVARRDLPGGKERTLRHDQRQLSSFSSALEDLQENFKRIDRLLATTPEREKEQTGDGQMPPSKSSSGLDGTDRDGPEDPFRALLDQTMFFDQEQNHPQHNHNQHNRADAAPDNDTSTARGGHGIGAWEWLEAAGTTLRKRQGYRRREAKRIREQEEAERREEERKKKEKEAQVRSELEALKKRIREQEEAERREEERKKKEKEAQVRSELEALKKRIREQEEAERREEERKKKEKEAQVRSELEALKAQVATKKRRANVEISEPAKRERKDEDNKKVVKEKEPTTPNRAPSMPTTQKRQPIYKSSIPQPHPLRQVIKQPVIVAPQKRNEPKPVDMNKTMDTDYDDDFDSFWDD